MSNDLKTSPGTLYVVATPIGNLEDITLRALRILKEVDMIAAEDTRHTKKLLNHFDINTPLISYYREKEQERGREILEKLRSGLNIALVSDAGTPAISDPGAVLVELCHLAQITVCPIPGPSALTAALSCSGFSDGRFLFIGFSPAKKNQRRKLLDSLVHSEYPVVFYEAPRRIEGFLTEALESLGNREILWAREITKSYEEFRRSSLQALVDDKDNLTTKGEFVLIISPANDVEQPEGDNVEELLIWYRDNSDLSLKDTCRQLASDLGLSRSQVYQQALAIWKDK
ncbi:16S rRNA (cytidine(1402)-2'-O)-methyltransferase [Desulfopila sp. IMCC35008]|uniref:16S rRNA (cytidine(1402)-2'-O)-methyltransferase n=1 Tax=Desulfopila sp. IMCC35008 TaxID=2653858 RepID=UPI0013D4258A|nr:16S rRNA (cytidine(1402)-2'-O)-methyltransferase [Desulfopila sp. IMCC35008]